MYCSSSEADSKPASSSHDISVCRSVLLNLRDERRLNSALYFLLLSLQWGGRLADKMLSARWRAEQAAFPVPLPVPHLKHICVTWERWLRVAVQLHTNYAELWWLNRFCRHLCLPLLNGLMLKWGRLDITSKNTGKIKIVIVWQLVFFLKMKWKHYGIIRLCI